MGRQYNHELLRMLKGRRLECGCVAGVYETYAGDTVTVVEQTASGCDHPGHGTGMRVGEDLEPQDARSLGAATTGQGAALRLLLLAALACASLAQAPEPASRPRQRGGNPPGQAEPGPRGRGGQPRTFKTAVPAHDVDVVLVRPTDTTVADRYTIQ